MMRRKELPSVEEVCRDASRIVVLEEVMNPTNVGAIFRSAAALGMDAILLTKGCSDPLYRRAIRVSMGNVFRIPWTIVEENHTKGQSLCVVFFFRRRSLTEVRHLTFIRKRLAGYTGFADVAAVNTVLTIHNLYTSQI